METDIPSAPITSEEAIRITIVAARYNEEFTDGLLNGARGEFATLFPNAEIEVIRVPGAFEVPVVVEKVARRTAEIRPEAILGLGVIIRGSTAHADLIAASITDSFAETAREHLVPVIHEVLLVDNEDHARKRTALDSHINRGVEAARAAAEMVGVMRSV